MMEFNYALQHTETGLLYTGETGDHWIAKPSLDHPPFTYTALGASRKAATFQNMRLPFIVKRIN